ncbi:hypothetical protein AB0C93_07510 [Streptomyces sp. NPDC048518]|uniref:hypothetical protein n=1 Tax=Streptomyces sp. NPDC048518 TaxID=3155029 RepID=UPI0033CF9562
MARHTATPSSRPAARALLRAGLTVTAAGAALGVGGAGAAAAVEPAPAAPLEAIDPGTPVQALTTALHHSTAGSVGAVKKLQLDPLANTTADPLDNTLGTQVADFKPVSTAFATGPLTEGGSLTDLPAVGGVTDMLPG